MHTLDSYVNNSLNTFNYENKWRPSLQKMKVKRSENKMLKFYKTSTYGLNWKGTIIQ